MIDLWIASGNAKKRVELERLLAGLDYRVRTLAELERPIEIIEDGDSFAANAAIKAVTLSEITGGLAIGDDSGLCVDALGGRPGIHSARYAGADAADRDRIAKLLGELAGIDRARRTAAFHCAICLAHAGTVLATFEGECRGEITAAPSGHGGFGYDPVFAPHEFRNHTPAPTFAELTSDQKDSISHRGQALRALIDHLNAADPISS